MRGMHPPDKKKIKELMDVSMGRQKADLVIVGGDVLNVYTGELLRSWSVAIKGQRIAYVGDDAGHTMGQDTEIIDASGRILIPGLIDGHTHLLMYYTLSEFLKYAMRGGTTTIVSEAIELAFPYGYEGIVEFLDSAQDQPIKIFATVPPMSSISRAGQAAAIDTSRLKTLLHREDVVGLGETVWSDAIRGDKNIFSLFAETLKTGKRIEGHAAGARGIRLASFISTGVSSCHESTTVEEVIERLRLGIHTMIREGDIRAELEVISKIKDMDIDFRRLVLVTDGVGPERLITDGYMEYVVQRAIDFGFDPITAIQMATLNPAEHFGLDHMIGGIAPSRYADIVIIPDLKKINAELVISNGQVIARERELLVQPRECNYMKRPFASIDIPRKLNADDFVVRTNVGAGPVRARVIDLTTPLVTHEKIVEVSHLSDEIQMDIERDILKVAAVTCGHEGMSRFVGLIRGFGIKRGAFATSAVWDVSAIVVVGAHEKDMAKAVNRIVELRGGIVVIADGKILAELAMPVGGIVSDQPLGRIAQRLDEIQQGVKGLGCQLPDAHLSLSILTTPYIPFLRISEEGLVDLKNGRKVNLIISE